MHTREASALDLFTDSVRIMGDATLCAVVEFDRRLDPITLGHAADACLLAHPILRSRLVRGSGPAYWEMAEGARHPPVRIEECAEDYYPCVIGPVDPYKPLQFRARLLRRHSGDIVVVNLSHAAADAHGLVTLVSQLLQEYRNPETLRPDEGGIPERDTLWTQELDRGVGEQSPVLQVINPMWPDPFGRSSAPSSYHREIISVTDLAAIRAGARALAGTVNDAVVAAYFLAMSDLTGHNGPVDIFFPVNLRQHMNNGFRVMSNQANNVCFTMRRDDGEGMREILPRIVREIRTLKSGRIGIAEQAAMDKASDPEGRKIAAMVEQMAALQKRGLADIFFSNPGQIALPDIGGISDAYLCYPGGYMPTTCFITTTFRGRMTVTMGYQDSRRAREGTSRALDLFCGHLRSIAGGTGPPPEH